MTASPVRSEHRLNITFRQCDGCTKVSSRVHVLRACSVLYNCKKSAEVNATLCGRTTSAHLVCDYILCALHTACVTKVCLCEHYRKIITGVVLLFMS